MILHLMSLGPMGFVCLPVEFTVCRKLVGLGLLYPNYRILPPLDDLTSWSADWLY
jgi:hypothetical protein